MTNVCKKCKKPQYSTHGKLAIEERVDIPAGTILKFGCCVCPDGVLRRLWAEIDRGRKTDEAHDTQERDL